MYNCGSLVGKTCQVDGCEFELGLHACISVFLLMYKLDLNTTCLMVKDNVMLNLLVEDA